MKKQPQEDYTVDLTGTISGVHEGSIHGGGQEYSTQGIRRGAEESCWGGKGTTVHVLWYHTIFKPDNLSSDYELNIVLIGEHHKNKERH